MLRYTDLLIQYALVTNHIAESLFYTGYSSIGRPKNGIQDGQMQANGDWYHSTKTRTLENGRKIASPGYYNNPLPIANLLLVCHAFAESTSSPENELPLI
jgi:hypothetical protein